MKLLRAYITAFGKYEKEAFDFSKPLLCYCKANGEGKSTLVAFLTAMLYGMSTDKKNKKPGEMPERKHYLPFGGGDYGGSLTLEVGKDTYVIERTFDTKSETKDTLTLIKNDKNVDLPSHSLGEEFFGLDRDSFRKTIRLDSDDLSLSSTDSIAAKLQNEVDDTTDMNNFHSACDALEEAAKKYKKSRGEAGSIDVIKGRLLELESLIHNDEAIEASLPPKYAKRKELKQSLESDEAKHKRILSSSGIEANRKTLVKLAEELKVAEGALESIKAIHPKGIPSKEQLAELDALGQKENQAQIIANTKKLTSVEEATLIGLEGTFHEGVPSDDALKDIEEDILAYGAMGKEEGKGLEEENVRLYGKFRYREPSEEDIAAYEGQLGEYKELGKKRQQLPATIVSSMEQEGETVTKRPKGLVYGSFGVALALLGGGAGLCFVQLLIGIVLLILGVIALGLALFLALSKTPKKTVTSVQVEKANPEIEALEKKRQELERNIESFLAPFGSRREEGIEANFALFKVDYASYQDLCNKAKDADAKKALEAAKKEELGKKIRAFFTSYKLEGEDFRRLLEELKNKIVTYKGLKQKKEEADLALKASEEAKAQYEKYRKNLREAYAYEFALIEEARSYQDSLDRAQKDVQEKKNRYEAFLKEHPGLDEAETSFDESAEEVDKRLASTREELGILEAQIKEDEERMEELARFKEEEESKKEELEQQKKEHGILVDALKYLKEAEEEQNNKYLSPILNSFAKYADELGSALKSKIRINRAFKVTFEENGKIREEGHLSSGERSLVLFCLRLALLENMFEDEKPFLILDDPFIYLDDEHMEKLKQALPKMAKQWQVLYFCCSKAKALEEKE